MNGALKRPPSFASGCNISYPCIQHVYIMNNLQEFVEHPNPKHVANAKSMNLDQCWSRNLNSMFRNLDSYTYICNVHRYIDLPIMSFKFRKRYHQQLPRLKTFNTMTNGSSPISIILSDKHNITLFLSKHGFWSWPLKL